MSVRGGVELDLLAEAADGGGDHGDGPVVSG
jgi:hypothetical protein